MQEFKGKQREWERNGFEWMRVKKNVFETEEWKKNSGGGLKKEVQQPKPNSSDQPVSQNRTSQMLGFLCN